MATKSTSRKGQCVNNSNCSKARIKKIIEVNPGEEFKCPECEEPLVEIKSKKFPWWIVIVAAVILIGGAVAALFYTGVISLKKAPEPVAAVVDEPELPPAIEEETILIEEEPLPVFIQTIVLDREGVLLKEGETFQLKWTIVPEDAIADKLEWRSSDPTIATVKDGLIRAHLPGRTTIQIKDAEGNYAMAICDVSVEKKILPNTLTFSYGTYTGEIRNGKANGFGKLTFTRAYRISEYDKTQQRMAEPGDYVEGQFENNNFYSGKWFDRYGNQKGAIILQKLGL